MPEQTQTMKCPFRQDEHGEFCDCYGQACMAYYVYTPIPVTVGQGCYMVKEQPPMQVCRRMASFAPSYGGCT